MTHKVYKVSLSRSARQDITRLIKELEDEKTVKGRDPLDPFSFSCMQITKLAEFGEKAIPSLQAEYLRLKQMERKIVREISGVVGATLIKLSERRYALRTRRYAIMNALLKMEHSWNVDFFAVELCAHFDPSINDFAQDEYNRGDSAIRVRAARYLRDNGGKKSVHNLVWALWDFDKDVRMMAATALRRITQLRFGVTTATTQDETARAVEAWRDWYQGYLYPDEK